MGPMYRKENQISLTEFYTPFGTLNAENRWIETAKLIPWDGLEHKYAALFCEDNGAPAKPFRMALGALLIKQETGFSDDDTLQAILENPYMQYFIGLHEFTHTTPFTSSMMVLFRKRLTADILKEINEIICNPPPENNKGGGTTAENAVKIENPEQTEASETELTVENKGTLIVDATCTPADVTYPTDVNLLNEAREKLEGMIDALHPHTEEYLKPRTYRKKARKQYLSFIKNRKPSPTKVRVAIRQQLGFVERDIRHVDNMLSKTGAEPLSNNQNKWLETIKKLFEQQNTMYKNRTHSIEDRIVSISQPHVRPIVRGKKSASVEFGAKVSISLVNGYTFVDKIGWDAYAEADELPKQIEAFRNRFGHYPAVVQADKVYRNRDNRTYCQQRGIRLSGPRLGRPPKEKDPQVIRQQRKDAGERNAVEGKFGEGKTAYGLARIAARLKDTAEAVIVVAFLCMNLKRKLHYFFVVLVTQYFPWSEKRVFLVEGF